MPRPGQEIENYLYLEIFTSTMPESIDEDLRHRKWYEDIYLPWALELVRGSKRDGWHYRMGQTPDCLTLGEADAQARDLFPEDIRAMLRSHTGECETCDRLVSTLAQMPESQVQEQPQHPLAALYQKLQEIPYRLIDYINPKRQ